MIKTSKSVTIIGIVLVLIICLLTLGFATFSTEFGINGLSAVVRIQKDIRLSGITLTNTTSNSVSSWEEYNVNSIAAIINLPNSDSTVTYNVKVTNLGNVEASISQITGLPNNLVYTLNNYNLRDMMCDDLTPTQCKLGSTTTISITIGYANNGYDSNNTSYNIGMDFTFSYMTDAVAKIGDSYYDTLQEAINAVPTNNTQTTIILLKNTSEAVSILAGKNIILNLNEKTLSNLGNTNVIKNYGTLQLLGGTISSNASTNGAVNNESNGTLVVSSGRIIMTGGRQAIYNDGGNTTITGTAYLSSSATARATVQNNKNSCMTITGGTIISTGLYAVNNAATLTIGVKDGNVSTSYPLFQAVNYGIYSTTNFSFYDGVVKSKTDPFYTVARITDKETDYGIVSSTETINGETYNISYLGVAKTVRFNANGGTVGETIRYVGVGHEVGPLPTPLRSGHDFVGWFTLKNGGVEVNSRTTINDDVTFFAHWNKTQDVAQIGNTLYATLAEAIAAVPANTQTTITMLKDISEYVIVAATKNIVLDLNGQTLRNSGNNPIIENNGILSISDGSLRTSATQSAINNVDGYLTIDDTTIVATSTKQAIYITGGTVEITGDSYLSSKTSGTPTGTTMERGTVQVISGNLIITGGTIVGENQQAVSNEGTLTIGVKDGNINSSTPVLIGAVHGLKSTGTVNFYDGIIKGKTDAINGPVSDQESNSQVINGVEIIDGNSYRTAYLETIE